MKEVALRQFNIDPRRPAIDEAVCSKRYRRGGSNALRAETEATPPVRRLSSIRNAVMTESLVAAYMIGLFLGMLADRRKHENGHMNKSKETPKMMHRRSLGTAASGQAMSDCLSLFQPIFSQHS